MKSALMIALACVALAVFADEPKTAARAAETTAEASAPATDTVAPDVAATDSPLVAAAKRARRGRKASSTVITNDTLAESGSKAHVTTTGKQYPIVPTGPARTLAQLAAEKEAQAARDRKLADEKAKATAIDAQKRAKAAASAEDGYEGGHSDDADELVGSEQKPPVH